MQTTKILLALFVILTIAFATLAAFEYSQTGAKMGWQPKTTTQTTTQVLITTLTKTLASQPLPTIVVGGTAFTYTKSSP